jgi:E3 ubiquitin-protein ligase RNF115/126
MSEDWRVTIHRQNTEFLFRPNGISVRYSPDISVQNLYRDLEQGVDSDLRNVFEIMNHLYVLDGIDSDAEEDQKEEDEKEHQQPHENHNYYDIMYNTILESTMAESLNYYKTSERKPDVKLILNSRKFNGCGDSHCSICVSDYESNDNVSELLCGHLFHTECISEWGMYKAECPICRSLIPTNSIV